jgi:cytochrome P450
MPKGSPRAPTPIQPTHGYANLFRYRRNHLAFLSEVDAAFGPCTRLRMGPMNLVVVSDPAMTERALVGNVRNYSKQTRLFRIGKHLLGNGLLTSEGSFWLRQRRLAQPAFHREKLQGFVDVMLSSVDDAIEDWIHQGTIDLEQEMMRLTSRIVCRALFSVDIVGDPRGPRVTAAFDELLEKQLLQRVLSVALPLWVPTPMNQRWHRAVAELDGFIMSIIEQRRALVREAQQKSDFLGMLMDAKDEDTGETMSDRQLRDELLTIYFAGHETTSNTLLFAVAQLMTDASQYRTVTDDVRTQLGQQTPQLGTQVASVNATIDETLRLYPAAPFLSRRAMADDQLGAVHVRKGDYVLLSPYLTHRSPRWWEDPLAFRLDRAPDPQAHKYRFFPFGGGQRKCMGDQFSLLEQRILLSRMVQRCVFAPAAPVVVEPFIAVTLRNKHRISLQVGRA